MRSQRKTRLRNAPGAPWTSPLLDTFIEFKRRIGSTGGNDPNPQHVEQLDDYLAQSNRQGRVRMGILTDGKHWVLRWPNAGPVRPIPPFMPSRWKTRSAGSPYTSGSATTPFPQRRTYNPPGSPSPSASAPTAHHTSAISRPSEPYTTSTPVPAPSRSRGSFGRTCSQRPWAKSPALPLSWMTCSSVIPT